MPTIGSDDGTGVGPGADVVTQSGFPRKHWVTSAVDDGQARELAEALELPFPIARILVSRGLATPEAARSFLNPRLSDLADPNLLPDISAAVARIWRAITASEGITVFGDYDVDGVCSTALLVRVLRVLGARVTPFLPSRIDEGYGLSVEALQRCLDVTHPNLIITVDCGSGSVAAVRRAKLAGVDVIVTDHHEVEGEAAPALAVVNPKLVPDHPSSTLAGVGVAFKLCHALIKAGLQAGYPGAAAIDLRDYLDLVAVATVADVVPLVGENRILASHGLRRLNEAPRVGFRALLSSAGVRSPRVDSYQIGFVLGPRLNAAGRMGDAGAALELLLTDDPQVAAKLAAELEIANRERKAIEDGILTEAKAELDAAMAAGGRYGLVVGKPGWHIGTVGIVASRLMQRYWRPIVVLGFDESGRGRGSCRSIESLDVLEVLRECESCLTKFGGHKMAAGVEVDASRFSEFQTRFDAACRSRLAQSDLRPVQRIDAWIQLGEADDSLMESLNRLRPLGAGNPEPIWGVANVSLAGPARRVGQDSRHLKLQVVKGASHLGAVGFNLGEFEIPPGELDVVFQLRENSYNGRVTLQLEVADLRPAAVNRVAAGCALVL